MEGFGTGSKYIVALEFVPEVINCAIVLVGIAVLLLFLIVILFLVLRFFIASDPPLLTIPPQAWWDLFDSTLL